MKYFVFVFSLFIYSCFFRSSSQKTCNVLIDPDYSGDVSIYIKPFGKPAKILKQDFKNEDYLVFTILDQNSQYFYGILSYSISGKHLNGWIKKAKYIGTYGRNYGIRTKLNLYTASSFDSPIKNIISDWTSQLYQVTKLQ